MYCVKHLASGLVFEQPQAPSLSQLEEYLHKTLLSHNSHISVRTSESMAAICEIIKQSTKSHVIVDETTWRREIATTVMSPRNLSGRHSRELFSFLMALLPDNSAAAITAICPTNMLNDLIENGGSFNRRKCRKKWCTYKLLAIDEVGYMNCDNRFADLLYEVILGRYQKHSTILTTNRG